MESGALSHGATQIGIPQSITEVVTNQYFNTSNVSNEHLVSKRSA